jgi:hypothetical protein
VKGAAVVALINEQTSNRRFDNPDQTNIQDGKQTMSNSLLSIALAAGIAASLTGSAIADTVNIPLAQSGQGQLILVSGGCGPNGWRGRWGHCHWNHYAGWGPYGYYAAGPYRVMAGPYWNRSCPPGYWRGPWGHCRDTPYHGPLPGGGYKP